MAKLIETGSLVEQNFKPERSIQMTIDPAAQGRIIRQSINMYQDAPAAVAREYMTNAWDSHVAAGKTDVPIEVSVPSSFGKSELVIKDYGVGLDDDGLDIYVSVGTSTKNVDGSEETGSFGQGCKSALAITSQFTVVAVKDGIKRFTIVGEDDKGGYGMDILKTVETDEPNGVTVKIPLDADEAQKMPGIVAEFAKYWDKGTVLVDGEAPTHWLDDKSSSEAIVLDAGTVILEGYYDYHRNDNIRVKMGAVTYPVDLYKLWDAMNAEERALFGSTSHHFTQFPAGLKKSKISVVLNAEFSKLKLVPSRDALIYTHKEENTVGTLVQLFSQLKEEADEHFDSMIENAKTYGEAEIIINNIAEMTGNKFNDQKFQFNGKKYHLDTHAFDHKNEVIPHAKTFYTQLGKTGTMHNDKYGGVSGYNKGSKRFVVNCDGSDSELSSHRKKVKDYISLITDAGYTQDDELVDNQNTFKFFLYSGVTNNNPWVFDNDTITYISIEELSEKVLAYRKYLREIGKTNNGSTRKARTETAYETISVEHYKRSHLVTVSDLSSDIETVVMCPSEVPYHGDVKNIMEEKNLAFMSLKGGRSENKLRENLEKAGFTAIDFLGFKNMISKEVLEDKVSSKTLAWENAGRLGVRNSIISDLVFAFDKGYIEDMSFGDTKISDWSEKNLISYKSEDFLKYEKIRFMKMNTFPSKIDVDEEVLASIPNDESMGEKYPMLDILIERTFGKTINSEQEGKKVVEYINLVNSAKM